MTAASLPAEREPYTGPVTRDFNAGTPQTRCRMTGALNRWRMRCDALR